MVDQFITLTYDFTSIDKALKRLASRALIRDSLKWGQADMTKRFRRLCPKDTGAYAKSWKVEIKGDSLVATTTQGDIMTFLEEGTKPHIIRAKYARFLRWEDENGNVHFAKQVMHPGTKPQPHVQKILRQSQRALLNHILAEIEKALNA